MDKASSEIEKELDENLSLFGQRRKPKGLDQMLQDKVRRMDVPGVPLMEVRPKSRTVRQPHAEESVY
jgi:hypothetical protein